MHSGDRSTRRPDASARARSTSLARGASVACAALVVGGCGVGSDVMSSVGMPAAQTSTGAGLQSLGPRSSPSDADTDDPGTEPGPVVTPRQRSYLDALQVAGVRPSTELAALSIGSSVCQARAARKTDQAVWDFVMPMVRGDVRDEGRADNPAAPAPPAGQITSLTADYIRIATDRLC